jgi:6-phosphogluconolactonase (cycloisomerase 2 family)
VVYVTVSPDGSSVYAASQTSNAVAVFSRDAGTGALSQLGGTAGNCANGIALAVMVSPDGSHVYAGSYISDALTSLARGTGGAPV